MLKQSSDEASPSSSSLSSSSPLGTTRLRCLTGAAETVVLIGQAAPRALDAPWLPALTLFPLHYAVVVRPLHRGGAQAEPRWIRSVDGRVAEVAHGLLRGLAQAVAVHLRAGQARARARRITRRWMGGRQGADDGVPLCW